MTKLRSYFFSIALVLSSNINASSIAHQSLVAIHGFLGAPWNMAALTEGYKDEGVNVICWGYPSRDKIIQDHGKDLVKDLQALSMRNPGVPINYITHSMGGLVLRSALNEIDCPSEAKLGRAVLIAPPNQGAAWGRFLDQIAFFQKIARDLAGKQLMTEEDFEFLGQFPETMEVMVIAGDRNLNPFFTEPSDGTVAVEETRLKTPHKHVIIHSGHKSILFNPKAAKLAKKFLKED